MSELIHNPEKVPEEKVPQGWRFLYANETEAGHPRIRVWLNAEQNNGVCGFGDEEFGEAGEIALNWTYIVPDVFAKSHDPKGPAGALKPQLQLIPPVLSEEAAKAHALGAQKYGPWNWRSSQVEVMTYIGAMKRHIDAFMEGQDIDPESGAHHLGHVATGCGIVLDAARHGTLIDNRPPRKLDV